MWKISLSTVLKQLDDWQNQHALSVNGRFSRISDNDIMAVGEKYAIGTASKVLSRVRDAVTCAVG